MPHKKSTIMDVMGKLILQPNGCAEWPLACIHGYGAVKFEGRQRRVHRVMYEHFVGPIPDGMQLDHLCRNTKCANFAHLEVVTPWENQHRGVNTPAVRTHCPKGHPLSGDNVFTYHSEGYEKRGCRACREGAWARWAERHPDKAEATRLKRLETLREKRRVAREERRAAKDSQTHCVHGHLLEGENLGSYVQNGRTYRVCKTCARANGRRHDERRRKARDSQ